MKKLFMACGVAVVALCATSCGDKAATTGSEANKAFGDTIATSLGEYQGLSWNQNYTMNVPEADKARFTKEGILRGVQDVIMADTADQGYLSGLQIGLQMVGQLYRYEEAGIPVDRKKFMAEFAKAFKADSVSVADLTRIQGEFTAINQRANKIMQEEMMRRQEEALKAKENSPEAVSNREHGEAFIKAEKEKDPSIKSTESGLSYKVVKEGEGPVVGKEGRARVKYTGKLVDGTQFDANDDAEFAPGMVIPGFGEGLAMMQKGGKYVLYIPGEIAYGANGTPSGEIPPMATLVFEVEVLDVNPAE